jgi:hypothetical protein
MQLDEGAQEILAELTTGDGADIALLDVYPGIDAWTTHAIAYFSNASALCDEPRAHDFAVFGALYCVRHGLELWLKWVIQKRVMEDVLASLHCGADLNELIRVAQVGSNDKRERKDRRIQLVRALCTIRNVEAGLTHPACRKENISERFATERISNGPPISGSILSIAWPIPVHGHDLKELWAAAEDSVRARYEALTEAPELGEAMQPDAIAGICALLGAIDPAGDGFRYPSSLEGDWYLHRPAINLRALGQLAESLEDSVRSYRGAEL